MKMLLGLSEALPTLVEAKFKSAKAGQSLIFSPTELAIIRTTEGIPVCGEHALLKDRINLILVPITILPSSVQKAQAAKR
jgi:hypothetical protein